MILVDDRAGSGHLVDIPPLTDLASLTRLDAGDACFIGRGPDRQVAVGVEIKSITDLLSSVQSGRLQGGQLPKMRDAYDVVWLLVHGRWRAGEDGTLEIAKKGRWYDYPPGAKPLLWSYIEAWLMTAVESGVRVKTVEGEREVAIWLSVLSRWWEKRWDGHKGMCAFDGSREIPGVAGMGSGGALTRARVAGCLPGMGWKRSVAAAGHFPSVRTMINAGPEEWSEIDGIGLGIGQKIEEAVR